MIDNGIGYDPWAPKLAVGQPRLRARRAQRRRPASGSSRAATRTAGTSRPTSHQVIDQITADYKALDPADTRRTSTSSTHAFVSTGLAALPRADRRDQGDSTPATPVGASESIFAPLADALGLDLITPATFLDAISEGTDPTAADKATVDSQIKRPADQGVRVQQPELDARRPGAGQRRPRPNGIPVTTDHRDARARRPRRSRTGRSHSSKHLEARAGRGDRRVSATVGGDRSATVNRRRRPEPSEARGGRGARRGGRARRSARVGRRRPHRSGAASSSPCSAPTASASRPWSRPSWACVPLAGGEPAACSAAGPGRRNDDDRLPAAAAQLRPGPARPRRRHRAPRPRRRPVGHPARRSREPIQSHRRSESAGRRGHRPRRRRRATPSRPIGELSGGEQQRLLIAQALVRQPACCSSTSRSTASTCPTRPRSPRSSRASAATTASPC